MVKNIAYLPGDGVGPEVAAAARSVLDAAAEKFSIDITYTDCLFGGAAIDDAGDPYPDATRIACQNADAILLGAVGGPKWDSATIRPEVGLLAMRKGLGLYANLRPTTVASGMEHLSPLRSELVTGVDFVVVRELTGGIYFGKREEGEVRATDECLYTKEEVLRIARIAFETARKRNGRVTSVDKANVLATSRLWRSAVNELHNDEYSDIKLDHMLVDAMTMKLIQSPADYDVIVTENMFGDIISDEASVLAGSIGLAPSASLGASGAGVYEPIHGSAPDIAGENKANPVGAILSAAMMLRYSLDEAAAADAIDAAVAAAVAAGHGTGDIGGADTCSEFSDRICAVLS